jgi:hypothetical protein
MAVMPHQVEHTRKALHSAVATILRVWPRALVDTQRSTALAQAGRTADGMPRAVGGHSDPTASTVATAVDAAKPAVAWLAELGDVLASIGVNTPNQAMTGLYRAADTLCADPDSLTVRRIFRLADRGAQQWPAPTRKPNAPLTGAASDAEECGLCGILVQSGRNEAGNLLLRRIDGQAYHATAEGDLGACYWRVWRQRRDRTA